MDTLDFHVSISEFCQSIKGLTVTAEECTQIIKTALEHYQNNALLILSYLNVSNLTLQSLNSIFMLFSSNFLKNSSSIIENAIQKISQLSNSVETLNYIIDKTIVPDQAFLNSLKKNDYQISDFLLEKYPDLLEKKDENDYTPLILASENGNINTIKYLLKKSANVHAKNCYQSTALHRACANGYVEIIDLLYQNGANIEETDDDALRPLHYCILRDNDEALRKILELKADPLAKNKRGETPAQMAARCKSLRCLEILNSLPQLKISE
ncbi:hypothetical protein TVAG_049720 [Trichomonas vaginalis G3]|uniref:Uncharacterized protein n=1 Tax=Trichomonas vaginalis (strain ATCC PRA-98 / G3) TaxID=412133 RepID=A2EVW7_TRIV3|nr:protein ubiquitination [Trichomonas vaginalis G3]EAY03188.1 hypothetical protein TVAG_049720 [Trichomonas vaginalis G3]KAI5520329.1 protein ubiquitination [Trichomonas vaginalis G3]|eukprot:XP_001315411.1 hypothetical protein [Trichomonas vaginalis G3]